MSGKPHPKMPERVARLKAFQRRCEVSGNLMIYARKAQLCDDARITDRSSPSWVLHSTGNRDLILTPIKLHSRMYH